ncbi:MAG: EamA family transporter [Clostridiales bacterium]|nr:EamA family transporter [Clostridiales bacterium]
MRFLSDREEIKVVAAYIVVCIVWGSTYLGIRIGVSDFPPELFSGIRNLVAGSIILMYARVKGLEFPKSSIDIRRLATVGFLLLCGSMGLISWAEQWVHSGVASLMVASSPLMMALIETIVFKENTLGIKGWAGLLIGFGGVGFLVMSASGTGSIDIFGSILVILAAFFWSSGSVYSKRFKAAGSVVTHIGIQMLAGGVGLTTAGLLLGEASRVRFTVKSMAAMAYLIIFGSILAYSCYIYVLGKWPSSRAGTYAYVNPLVAVTLGFLVLGEPITYHTIISMVVILGGVLMVQVSQASRQRKEQNAPS